MLQSFAMRLIAFVLLTCVLAFGSEPALAPFTARGAAVLRWVDTNPPGSSAHYIVQVSIGNRIIESERVNEAAVKLRTVLGNQAPGEYEIRIITVSEEGLASEPSKPITITWLGDGIG